MNYIINKEMKKYLLAYDIRQNCNVVKLLFYSSKPDWMLFCGIR